MHACGTPLLPTQPTDPLSASLLGGRRATTAKGRFKSFFNHGYPSAALWVFFSDLSLSVLLPSPQPGASDTPSLLPTSSPG